MDGGNWGIASYCTLGSLSYLQISKHYRIPRVSIPISSILIEIFSRTHGPEVSLGRVFVAVVSVFITGQQSSWQYVRYGKQFFGKCCFFIPLRNQLSYFCEPLISVRRFRLGSED